METAIHAVADALLAALRLALNARPLGLRAHRETLRRILLRRKNLGRVAYFDDHLSRYRFGA